MRKAHVSKRPTKGGDDIVHESGGRPQGNTGRRGFCRDGSCPSVTGCVGRGWSFRLHAPCFTKESAQTKSATKNVAKDPLDRKGLQIELQQRVRAGGASRRSPPRGLLRPNLSEPQGSTKPNRCRPLKLRRRESWKARVPPPNLVVGWRLTADDSVLILARAQEVDQGAHRVAVRRPRVSQAGGGHGALE